MRKKQSLGRESQKWKHQFCCGLNCNAPQAGTLPSLSPARCDYTVMELPVPVPRPRVAFSTGTRGGVTDSFRQGGLTCLPNPTEQSDSLAQLFHRLQCRGSSARKGGLA